MTYWYVDGKKWLEENYKNGLKNGKLIGYYPNGRRSTEQVWENNKLDGPFVNGMEMDKRKKKVYIKQVKMLENGFFIVKMD